MSDLPNDISSLVTTDKRLLSSPVWDNKSDQRYFKLIAPLEVMGSSISGFQLRVHISKQFVDKDAMIQLEFVSAGKRSSIPLWRVDWRCFARHSNKERPPDIPFMLLPDTHQHPFEDNYLEREIRMLARNLPAARPLNQDVSNLGQLLAFCGENFRIQNMDRINLPSITGDLFWERDD